MCLSFWNVIVLLKFAITKIISFALFFTKKRMMALCCHQYHSRMEAADTRMNTFAPTHLVKDYVMLGQSAWYTSEVKKLKGKEFWMCSLTFSKNLAHKDERVLIRPRQKHEVFWNRSVLLSVQIEQLPWNRFAYYLSFWYICFVSERKQMLLAHPQFWMNDLIWWWPIFLQIYFYSVLILLHLKALIMLPQCF